MNRLANFLIKYKQLKVVNLIMETSPLPLYAIFKRISYLSSQEDEPCLPPL